MSRTARLTGIHDDVLDRLALRVLRIRLRPLLEHANHLVDLCGKQIQRSHDGAVGPEVVVLHDISVLDRLADVDVAVEREVEGRGVEVDDIGRAVLGVKVRVDASHKGRLAGACEKHGLVSNCVASDMA
jgi:hypothetical protein